MKYLLTDFRQTMALKNSLPQAAFYDVMMARADAAGMAGQRRELACGLSGRVLEIGCGTGLMFAHYPAAVVVEAIEPDEDSLSIARRRAEEAEATIHVSNASALELPFERESFDAVVIALVLCTVPDVQRALAEVTRVLRKGAPVRLIEHVRSPNPVTGAFMSLLDPLWLLVNNQGCHMHRDTETELRKAGYELNVVVRFQYFAPGLPAFPMRRIEATHNAK